VVDPEGTQGASAAPPSAVSFTINLLVLLYIVLQRFTLSSTCSLIKTYQALLKNSKLCQNKAFCCLKAALKQTITAIRRRGLLILGRYQTFCTYTSHAPIVVLVSPSSIPGSARDSILDIISVDIAKRRIKKQDFKNFTIDKATKNSSSYEKLFDFIVNCIAKFIKDRNITKKLPIAFTFPFPMKCESLTCGKLVCWTGDFKATGGEGEDIIQLLKKAASTERKGVSVVLQLINCLWPGKGKLTRREGSAYSAKKF
jgi:hypothetical protein